MSRIEGPCQVSGTRRAAVEWRTTILDPASDLFGEHSQHIVIKASGDNWQQIALPSADILSRHGHGETIKLEKAVCKRQPLATK